MVNIKKNKLRNIIKLLKKNIFIENNVIEDLENLSKLNKNTDVYNKLYNKIINVGEYNKETIDIWIGYVE
jgi:hypothetical protein